MQYVERRIGTQSLQHRRDIATDVDLGNSVTLLLQRLGTGAARTQADLPFGRPASHEDSDMLG
jgi:hypothetical protein